MIRAKQKQLLRDLELLGCRSECVKFTLSIQLSFPQDASAPQLHFVMLLAKFVSHTHTKSLLAAASWVLYPVTRRKTKCI